MDSVRRDALGEVLGYATAAKVRQAAEYVGMEPGSWLRRILRGHERRLIAAKKAAWGRGHLFDTQGWPLGSAKTREAAP